ncbi:MAG: carboxyl transferase domain-containing protein, partial [Terriglobales bacterium]
MSRLHSEELQKRQKQALVGGGADRQQRQHEQGKLLARERIALLLDPGSFQESGDMVAHRTTDFGLGSQR